MKINPATSNELRSMVREVLHDVMAQRSTSTPSAVEPVRLSDDAELHAFVLKLMDPAVQEKIKSGKLRFTLGAAAAAPSSAAPSTALSGVVTEKSIDRLTGGSTLILGAGAVLTPLARDRARRLGLKIERRP